MDKKKLGKVIQDQRKQKHMRQYQVSEKTGLSRNYISDIENGRYMPSVETLAKLAICLDLDLNILTMTEIHVQQGKICCREG
ncbi:helix-turn-helix transcriptional regulator [Paenibacillus sp. Marseille-Q4541]|uniref:helix-turn-helix domain-containing protein n=1 Tax=Paenibacillus sp. Marseille-Q4541 TaxID=2831522 RepID=UPI001BAD7996|nr:helix-turn-helix transcriptional regulator [Paenibacillus sp. Marseille-Q4541]